MTPAETARSKQSLAAIILRTRVLAAVLLVCTACSGSTTVTGAELAPVDPPQNTTVEEGPPVDEGSTPIEGYTEAELQAAPLDLLETQLLGTSLPTADQLEADLPGGWELQSLRSLYDAPDLRCPPDPQFSIGYRARFESTDIPQRAVLTFAFRGDLSGDWITFARRLADCDFGLEARDLTIAGSDTAVALTSTGVAVDGIQTILVAQREEYVAFLVEVNRSEPPTVSDPGQLANVAAGMIERFARNSQLDPLEMQQRLAQNTQLGPETNLEHWHSVYGVYSCNIVGDGETKYLPPFTSTQDGTGLHSHGDGLIHIHPYFELSSGQLARLQLWSDEMGIEVTTERILVDNEWDTYEELVAGEPCADGTGPAEIKVLHWRYDYTALHPSRPAPVIIEADLGSIRFRNDREVFIIAYVGADTDLSQLPLPPQARFQALNEVGPELGYFPDPED